MKVTAIKNGFIHGIYRRPGDEFEIIEKEFSKNWMVKGEAEEELIKPRADGYIPLEIPSLMNKPKVEAKEAPKTEAKKTAKKSAKKSTKKSAKKAS